jgi:hypothetical protein
MLGTIFVVFVHHWEYEHELFLFWHIDLCSHVMNFSTVTETE